MLICKRRATQLQPKSDQPLRGGSYSAVCCVAPRSQTKRSARSSRLASNPNLSLQNAKYFLLPVVFSFLLINQTALLFGGHLEKALILNRQLSENKTEIIREFQLAEAEDPSDALYQQQALFYFENGKYEVCISSIKKIKKADYGANRLLALAYYFTGSFTDALHHFEIVISEAQIRKDDEAIFYFAKTQEKKNLFEEALKTYGKVEDPAFRPQATERISKLEKQIPLKFEDLPEEIKKIIKNAPHQEDHPQADGAVLLERENYEVFEDSTAVTDILRAVLVFNDRGKSRFAEVHLGYDSTYEEVEVTEAYTVKPDGSVVEVLSSAVRDVSKYLNFPLYSNARVKIISMPEVSPGSVIVYKARYRENKLVADGKVLYRYGVQGYEPCVTEQLTIKLPLRLKPNIKVFSRGYLEKTAALNPKIEKTDKNIIYRWEARDIPEIIPEDRMPSWCDVTDGFRLSTFTSWDEIYEWWKGMLEDRTEATPDIRAKTAELLDASSQTASAANIYNWVASQIRYVAVEYGEAGFRPHKADEIFTNKYGDCKDQAILLVTMLREARIKAYPVLIGTRGTFGLSEDFPELVFNHAIAACVIDGKIIFMDPTAETTPFGELPWGDQGRKVLVFFEDAWKIMETPEFESSENRVVKEMNISVGDEEKITVQRNVYTYGIYDHGQRYWLKYTKPVKIKEELQKKITSITPGARLLLHEVSGYENLKENCALKMSFEGENYFKKAGNFRILPQWGGVDTDIVSKVSRKYPLEKSFPSETDIKNTISLPAGFSAEFIPEEITEDNRWFSYVRKFTVSGNVLSYEEKTKDKGIPVACADYAKYREKIMALDKKARSQLIFRVKK